jgi:acetate kinase
VTLANPKRILTMNRGSSTLKSTLYEAGNPEAALLSISVDQAGPSGSHLKIAGPAGASLLDSQIAGGDPNAALDAIFTWLGQQGFLSGLAAVGQRLVHGGARYREPQRITPEFLTEIEKLIPLDPDHTPAAIKGIQFIAERMPNLPQIACFDTAFHSSLPTVARMYALPRRLYGQGIVRYGFHGLSYEYVMGELRKLEGNLADGRVIVAHLGSGASIAAIKQGKSTDTSMGFTPLEGLVMATRCGDVDPGILLYLAGNQNIPSNEMSKLLNKESGLFGVSGSSGDMRVLLDKMPRDSAAAEAVDLFCYRAKKYIGAYAAALGGLDVLVFAGGIGEHAPVVRNRICENLGFLGINLDESSNEADAALISSAESQVKVRVIKTNEDLMIVRHVLAILG